MKSVLPTRKTTIPFRDKVLTDLIRLKKIIEQENSEGSRELLFKKPSKIRNEHKITTFETARKLVSRDLKLALEILRNVM